MTDETNRLLSLRRIEHCINDARVWMAAYLLKVNDDKTVAIVLPSRNNEAKYSDSDITPSYDYDISAARNIGDVFDAEMSMVDGLLSM